MIAIKDPGTTYVLLAGLPGTGKSTLAAGLAASLHASVILNKDDVRAALFPGEATDYSEAQNHLCMEAMLAAAACLTAQRHPPSYIFFDGRTFSRADHLTQVIGEAESNGAAWSVLHLWCVDEIALQRLASGNASHPAKNRDAALYRSLKLSFEPIRHSHLWIDTSRPDQNLVHSCVTYLEWQRSLHLPLNTLE